MATFKEDQQVVAQAREALKKAEASFYRTKLSVHKAKNPDLLSEVKVELEASSRAYFDAEKVLSASLANLYRNHQLKEATAAMDANIPILFLPLRLETRFMNVNNRKELWVRIYPDDIHVHSHEPYLTENEVNYGKQYWVDLLIANRKGGEDKEAIKQKAWQVLNGMAGIQRALWIVKRTMPINWTVDLTVGETQLMFPDLSETKIHDWTRAPRTQILPDKFAVSIIRDGRVVQMTLGNQVPDTVFLGPDPFLAEEAFNNEENTITLDESFAWITNFDKAVQQGLGVKIPLDNTHFNRSIIDRVMVMGLMPSATPQEGKDLLEQLIDSHHYSHNGFSFMPQMSATNNTEETASAYEKNEDYLPKNYYDGSDIVDLDNLPNAEGNNFAEYLGIKSTVLKEVNHAGMVESYEASAMNKAIYSSTIGNFIEVLADPVVNKAAHPKLRQFFNDFVTAPGPLPCIRVGNQPYGTLLTSDLNIWKESDPFHSGLTKTLSVLQQKWDNIASNKVSHVGKPGDPGALMLNILGLSAGSVSFKQRLGNLPDIWMTMSIPGDLMGSIVHKQSEITKMLEELGFDRGENAYPYISNLSFYGFLNNISTNHLVDRELPSPTRFLEKNKITKNNYIEWLASVTKVNELESRIHGVIFPRSILFLLLRNALLQELKKGAEKYYTDGNVPYRRAAFEKSLYNFSAETQDLTEWEILLGVPEKVDKINLKVKEPIGDHFLNLRDNTESSRNLKEMRDAMSVLAKLPTSKLHNLLSDHIDLCSYRLDAWEMGLFYKRLLEMRKKNPEGIYLGAYGWVENLRENVKSEVVVPEALKPADGKPVHKLRKNAGFIHTPSLNHATAAGLLLSGYQNHATKLDPGPFAVNLSSERVRRALYVLEGVQNNQSIEALLGYQFERALHDITTNNAANNLNQYILAIRDKFPIKARSIPQQGNEAQETISPYSVVNGLKIIEATSDQIKALVANPDDSILVLKEKDRLEDTLDALNDLMVSEAAFQATQGKTDRTAAILNSLKNADVPPELEVNVTPRSTHLSITNRVTLHFEPSSVGPLAPGWSTEPSPRSAMEAGLNLWTGKVLGDPSTIVCSVFHVDLDGNESVATSIGLEELNLQPIDLMYSAGEDILSGAKELEYVIAKVYAEKVNVPKENRIHIKFEPENLTASKHSFASMLPLIRSLRLLVTSSRPANGKDFLPSSKSKISDPELLYGYNGPELKVRVNTALTKLKEELGKVTATIPNDQQPKNKENPANFQQLYEFHYEGGGNREYLESISYTDSAIKNLLSFLESGSKFGVKVSYPDNLDLRDSKKTVDLVAVVGSYLQTINKKILLAEEKLLAASGQVASKEIRHLVEAGKAVLGDDFVIVPTFTYVDQTAIADTLKADEHKQLLKFINDKEDATTELTMETWIASVAPVRPNMRRLEQLKMISEAQGGAEISFVPAQLPFKEKDTWLAVEFPELDTETGDPFNIMDNTICLSIHGQTAGIVSQAQSALVVDDWTESIPNTGEITGVAFNYDQPNATSPNSMLLAIEPTGSKNWDWDVLMGILEDTLKRSKSRAVEPAQLLEDVALDTLSPMTVASYDLQRSNISLDYLVTNDEFLRTMKTKDFGLYKDFE
ncbi:hypothetical protein [Arenibacter certesii]|uniref:Uncharacterized protein n=1 Tax=Arenibacter certesii TaxID=228955 RepID=A0A918IX44_9FLAO|nr:hypothetical protein [Arenibacter certesii]GGW37018.1 hypothetical protein GCM10007383_22340 [Arenibacter certesii]